eukprot:m.5881 g.5881  ORF g.5881 m.5881 type:complete len:312 (+) comp5100_c0_seq2:104-1039(+)
MPRVSLRFDLRYGGCSSCALLQLPTTYFYASVCYIMATMYHQTDSSSSSGEESSQQQQLPSLSSPTAKSKQRALQQRSVQSERTGDLRLKLEEANYIIRELQAEVIELRNELENQRTRQQTRHTTSARVHSHLGQSSPHQQRGSVMRRSQSASIHSQIDRREQEAELAAMTAKMGTMQHLATRNQQLLIQNDELRREVAKLRRETTQLLLYIKDTEQDSRTLQAQVVTSMAHRDQVQRRLDQSLLQQQQLEVQLDSVALTRVEGYRESKRMDAEDRWRRLEQQASEPPKPSRSRAKKAEPRRTRRINVESW